MIVHHFPRKIVPDVDIHRFNLLDCRNVSYECLAPRRFECPVSWPLFWFLGNWSAFHHRGHTAYERILSKNRLTQSRWMPTKHKIFLESLSFSFVHSASIRANVAYVSSGTHRCESCRAIPALVGRSRRRSRTAAHAHYSGHSEMGYLQTTQLVDHILFQLSVQVGEYTARAAVQPNPFATRAASHVRMLDIVLMSCLDALVMFLSKAY
jgi:hypothetical protein